MPLDDAVRQEYSRLAPAYDARWERYVRESTRFTLYDLPLPPRLRLLDVGCGTGYLLGQALEREPDITPVGLDLSREMLAVARDRLGSRARLVDGTAERLPFSDSAFDTVVTNSALHYVRDPERAIRELARVLRPGGTLVVADWSADRLAVRLIVLLLRILRRPMGTIYRARDLAALLEANGFEQARYAHRGVGWPWTIQRVVATRATA
ncbi:MAG: class I SAM-dependent methyltransferase [Gemmatimonadetes bacterium]|nr:class I SAM-dependent methyltransferase [Gemmatimonadota bacterium]